MLFNPQTEEINEEELLALIKEEAWDSIPDYVGTIWANSLTKQVVSTPENEPFPFSIEKVSAFLALLRAGRRSLTTKTELARQKTRVSEKKVKAAEAVSEMLD